MIPSELVPAAITGDTKALFGVVVAAALAYMGGARVSGASSRSASATEVEKLGQRLDKQAERIDAQDATISALRTSVRLLLGTLDDHDIEPPTLPEGAL